MISLIIYHLYAYVAFKENIQSRSALIISPIYSIIPHYYNKINKQIQCSFKTNFDRKLQQKYLIPIKSSFNSLDPIFQVEFLKMLQIVKYVYVYYANHGINKNNTKIWENSLIYNQHYFNQMKYLKFSRQHPPSHLPYPKPKSTLLLPSSDQNKNPNITKSNELLTKPIAKNNSSIAPLETPISILPHLAKSKQKTSLQQIKEKAKSHFRKMTTKEKFVQIEHIFKAVRQLCQIYGYFTVTEAMLQFNLDSPIKVSIWIHPNLKITKPLHPIRKKTQFECQLICVAELKNIVNELFINIDLGNAKTFTNIFAYINKYKYHDENDSSEASPLPQTKSKISQTSQKYTKKMNSLIVSRKTIPLPLPKKISQQLKQQSSSKKFMNNSYNKQTQSTLIQSIPSTKNLKQHISKTTPKPLLSRTSPIKSQNTSTTQQNNKKKSMNIFFSEHKPKHQATSPKSRQKQNIQKQAMQKLNPIQTDISIHQQSQPVIKSQNKIPQNSNYLHLKISTTSMKFMTSSIQIQSQINNLFQSTDNFHLNANYYSRGQQTHGVRNSMLSRVAQQFEDLF